jgi:shikimate dehydrogenase
MYVNLGIIGNPLSHSMSPTIHSRFLISSGLNGGYCCFETPSADNLPEVFAMLKKYKFRGISVTVPYKEEVIKFMNELEPLATDINAVNAIKFEDDGKLIGYNTDVYGFSKTLEENNLDLTNSRVLLLGCGGAAKAVLRCLKDYNGLKLTVVNRDTLKVEKTLRSLNFDNAEISDYNYIGKHSEFDTVINSTSLGLDGSNFADMSKVNCLKAAVDLQYKPWVTPFLRCYEGQECLLINGFSMLIHQAHRAFNIWTGVTPEIDMDAMIRSLRIGS